jgi:hypothetical protein
MTCKNVTSPYAPSKTLGLRGPHRRRSRSRRMRRGDVDWVPCFTPAVWLTLNGPQRSRIQNLPLVLVGSREFTCVPSTRHWPRQSRAHHLPLLPSLSLYRPLSLLHSVPLPWSLPSSARWERSYILRTSRSVACWCLLPQTKVIFCLSWCCSSHPYLFMHLYVTCSTWWLMVKPVWERLFWH